jgi:hypothetical protein
MAQTYPNTFSLLQQKKYSSESYKDFEHYVTCPNGDTIEINHISDVNPKLLLSHLNKESK